jgi:hypothetical protein
LGSENQRASLNQTPSYSNYAPNSRNTSILGA